MKETVFLGTANSGGQRAAVVLGMHRSGTSMTAQMIHHMGFAVGSRLLGADESNQAGYWEDIDVIAVNDLILKHAGGRWDCPPHLGTGHSLRDRLVSRLVQGEIRSVLKRYPDDHPWVIKDPRLSLTLSWWIPHFPQPQFILCVRNPLSVANSLARRNQFPIERGLELWYTYTLKALQNSQGWPLQIVHYEHFFTDLFPQEIGRMADFLGVDVSQEIFRDVVKRTLRHDSHAQDALLQNPAVDRSIRELYATLLTGDVTKVIHQAFRSTRQVVSPEKRASGVTQELIRRALRQKVQK